MAAIVDVTGNLRDLIEESGSELPFRVEGETVEDILNNLRDRCSRLDQYLEHTNVFVNRNQVFLPGAKSMRVPDGAELLLVQPISGGR
jgi:molybdopterin converting factor small subunit